MGADRPAPAFLLDNLSPTLRSLIA